MRSRPVRGLPSTLPMMRPPLLLMLLVTPLAALAGCSAGPGPAGPRDGADGGAASDGAIRREVSYHGVVRPILARHCEGCHVAGGIAPFPLDTYAIAAGMSMRIAEVTRARIMPPYPANASGECNTFRDARWLEESEIATLEAWHAAGAPEGDPSIPAPERMAPPSLAPSEVTASVALASEYTPSMTDDDTPLDDIRCFVVDPGLRADGFLTAYQVVPGEPRIVHHAILFEPESADQAAAAQRLEDGEPGLGYVCNGGPVVRAHPVVLWAPGTAATRFPEGTGLRIAPHPMVLQVHYNIAAGALPDRTRIDLAIAASVAREARILGLSDPPALQLPPRQAAAAASAEFAAPADGTVWGVFPHMHQRGRTMRVTRTGASEDCLLEVDRWSFMWQLGYYYETPIQVRRGERVRIDCTFDTSLETDTVTWGEGTGNEMCLSYFYVTASR